MKDIIIFGTGKYFESKKETLERKYHITAFLDNKIGINEHTGYQGTEIPMMNPEAVNQGDTTEIFLMSISFVSMWKQLCSIGVDPHRLVFPYMEEPYFESEDALCCCLEKIIFSEEYFECFCRDGSIIRITDEKDWRAFLRKAYRQISVNPGGCRYENRACKHAVWNRKRNTDRPFLHQLFSSKKRKVYTR